MKNKKITAGLNLSKIARNLMLVTSLLSPAFFIACAKQRLDDIEKIDCVAPNKQIKDFSVYRAAALSANNQQVSIRFQIDYCSITEGKNKQITVYATNQLDGTTSPAVTLTLPPNQKTISNVIANLALSDSGQTIPFTLTMTDDEGAVYNTSTSVAVPKFPSNISAFVTSNPANGATAVNVFSTTLDFVLSNGTLTQQEDPSGNLITVDTLVNNNLGSLQLMVGSTSYNYNFPNANVAITNGSTQTASLAVDSTKFNNGLSTAPVQLQYGAGVSWTYFWDDNAGGTFFQSGTFTLENNPIVQAGNASGVGLENEYSLFKVYNQSGTWYLEQRNVIDNYAVKTTALTLVGSYPASAIHQTTHFDYANSKIYLWGSVSNNAVKYGDAPVAGHYQTIIDVNTGVMTTVNFTAGSGYEYLSGAWSNFAGAPADTKVLFLENSYPFINSSSPVYSSARFFYNTTEDQTVNLAQVLGIGPVDSLQKGNKYILADQAGSTLEYNPSYSAGGGVNLKMSVPAGTSVTLPPNYITVVKIIDNPFSSQGYLSHYYDINGSHHLAKFSSGILSGYVALGASNILQVNPFKTMNPDTLFEVVDQNGQVTVYENTNFSSNTLGTVIYQYTNSNLIGLLNANAPFRPQKNESAAQVPSTVGDGYLWVDKINGQIRKQGMDGFEISNSPYPRSIATEIAAMGAGPVISTRAIYRAGGDILVTQYQNGPTTAVAAFVPGSGMTPLLINPAVNIAKIFGADVYLNTGTGLSKLIAAYEDPAKPNVITVTDGTNQFDMATVSGRSMTAAFKLLSTNVSGNKMWGIVGTSMGFDFYEIDRTDLSAVRVIPGSGTLGSSVALLTAIGADAATDVKIIDYQLTPECALEDNSVHHVIVLAQIIVGGQPYQVIFKLDINKLSPTFGTVTSVLVPAWIAKTSFHSILKNIKLNEDGTLTTVDQFGRIYVTPSNGAGVGVGVPDTTKGSHPVEHFHGTGITFDSSSINF